MNIKDPCQQNEKTLYVTIFLTQKRQWRKSDVCESEMTLSPFRRMFASPKSESAKKRSLKGTRRLGIKQTQTLFTSEIHLIGSIENWQYARTANFAQT